MWRKRCFWNVNLFCYGGLLLSHLSRICQCRVPCTVPALLALHPDSRRITSRSDRRLKRKFLLMWIQPSCMPTNTASGVDFGPSFEEIANEVMRVPLPTPQIARWTVSVGQTDFPSRWFGEVSTVPLKSWTPNLGYGQLFWVHGRPCSGRVSPRRK